MNEFYNTKEEAEFAKLKWKGYSKKVLWSIKKEKWRLWIGKKYLV